MTTYEILNEIITGLVLQFTKTGIRCQVPGLETSTRISDGKHHLGIRISYSDVNPKPMDKPNITVFSSFFGVNEASQFTQTYESYSTDLEWLIYHILDKLGKDGCLWLARSFNCKPMKGGK